MDTRKIEIITDSTCDIHQSLFEQYDIEIIPQIIIWVMIISVTGLT